MSGHLCEALNRQTRAVTDALAEGNSARRVRGRRESGGALSEVALLGQQHLSHVIGHDSSVPWAVSGVSDGTRTRDICDHNAALYQLSYTHRDPLRGRRESLAVITDGLEGGAGTIRVVFWTTLACPDEIGESQ